MLNWHSKSEQQSTKYPNFLHCQSVCERINKTRKPPSSTFDCFEEQQLAGLYRMESIPGVKSRRSSKLYQENAHKLGVCWQFLQIVSLSK